MYQALYMGIVVPMGTQTQTIDKINRRITAARAYMRVVGWARGTTGEPGRPVDIMGALRYCAPVDGYEVVAARMLASRGYDLSWNDLVCQNMFEALQAFDHTFTADEVAAVYGKRSWYAIVGMMQLLTMAGEKQTRNLASHFGPADIPTVVAAVERTGPSPAYEDAHIVLSQYGFDAASWLMTDALVANMLEFPDVDARLGRVLEPVARKLGLV